MFGILILRDGDPPPYPLIRTAMLKNLWDTGATAGLLEARFAAGRMFEVQGSRHIERVPDFQGEADPMGIVFLSRRCPDL